MADLRSELRVGWQTFCKLSELMLRLMDNLRCLYVYDDEYQAGGHSKNEDLYFVQIVMSNDNDLSLRYDPYPEHLPTMGKIVSKARDR